MNWLTACVVAVLLCGCDQLGRYEVVRAGSATFLLNKSSGEVHLVEGTSLVPLTPQPRQQEIAPASARTWPQRAIPQLGDVRVAVKTTHRDGAMKYIISASPYSAFANQVTGLTYAKLNIQFDDSDGFSAAAFEANVARGENTPSRIVDDKGEFQSLEWKGSVPMTRSTYDQLSSLTVGWAGFIKSDK